MASVGTGLDNLCAGSTWASLSLYYSLQLLTGKVIGAEHNYKMTHM